VFTPSFDISTIAWIRPSGSNGLGGFFPLFVDNGLLMADGSVEPPLNTPAEDRVFPGGRSLFPIEINFSL